MKPPARRCWWCTISIPRRKRLTPGRRARCPRRSTNSTSFLPAWDQVRRQNDAANPSNRRFRAAFSSAEDRFPFNAARYDCRVGAAEANDGLRASEWNQHVLRSPRRRRTGGVASRRVHDHHQQLGRVDQRALQNAESHCRRNARSRPHGGRPTRYHLRKPRRRRDRTAQLSQDPASHPDKVRRAVIISSTFRRDGMIAEAVEAIPKLTADAFKGSPIEAEYKKLSPTPDDFPNFVQRIVATFSKGYDFGADKLKATTTPMFFIHGDAEGVRLAHVAEMFRLKGAEIHGDMKPRSA